MNKKCSWLLLCIKAGALSDTREKRKGRNDMQSEKKRKGRQSFLFEQPIKVLASAWQFMIPLRGERSREKVDFSQTV